MPLGNRVVVGPDSLVLERYSPSPLYSGEGIGAPDLSPPSTTGERGEADGEEAMIAPARKPACDVDSRRTERRWRWSALLLALIVLNIGCSPIIMMNFLLAPWMDDKITPVYPLACKDKEIKVAIAAHHATLELRPELAEMHQLVAARLAQHLELRFKENKEKVKVVPPTLVRSYQTNQQGGYVSPEEIGKHFQADYVIALEMEGLSLYEKGSREQLYRGHAEVQVKLVDVRKPAGEGERFDKTMRWDYPSVQRYIDANEMSWGQFRSQFVDRIAKDLSQLFAAHPPRERYESD
jgi:hypothetical protein